MARARELDSLAELARRVGVTPPAVRAGVASGRVPASCLGQREGRTIITDMDGAVAAWRAHHPRAGNAATKGGGGGRAATLAEAQRRVAVERAKKLAHENRAMRGQSVLVRDAARDAFADARTIRDRMLNLPARLAPEFAGESDAVKIFARLDAEIRAALESAASALEQAS